MAEDPDPFEYFVWVVRHEEAISHGSGPMPVPQKNYLLERFLKGFSVFVAEAHKLRVSDLEIVLPKIVWTYWYGNVTPFVLACIGNIRRFVSSTAGGQWRFNVVTDAEIAMKVTGGHLVDVAGTDEEEGESDSSSERSSQPRYRREASVPGMPTSPGDESLTDEVMEKIGTDATESLRPAKAAAECI
jgi:hypothetical protein